MKPTTDEILQLAAIMAAICLTVIVLAAFSADQIEHWGETGRRARVEGRLQR